MTATAFRIRTFLLAALLLGLLSLTAGATEAQALTITAPEYEQVKRINTYRANRGLPRLRIDRRLTRAARWKSFDLATHTSFAHVDSLGRGVTERLTAFGYPTDTWRGENLAAGYPDAARTFRQWRLSPPHHQNLVHRRYRAIGIALVNAPDSTYKHYWTTTFGSRLVVPL